MFPDMEDKNKDILKRYLDYHNDMIDKVGYSTRALYTTNASQKKRFRNFEKLFHRKQDFSLLDVGCGFGDFCGYLNEEGYQNIQFTGLDINERMTAESKKRFPDQQFVTGLVEALPQGTTYDYAIASGVYSLGESMEVVQDFFFEQFDQVYEKVNIGFAVNFLSSYSDSPDNICIYHDPIPLLEKCMKRYGKYVILTHDYLPHDFTIFVYKKMND